LVESRGRLLFAFRQEIPPARAKLRVRLNVRPRALHFKEVKVFMIISFGKKL
jgi:hypothetical protein